MGVLLTIALFLSTINYLHAGEVRCFCNLPLCVTSGYMCKSAVGGCFSDLFDFRDVYKARHGCMEQLESSHQGKCQNEPGSKRVHQRSLLLCCTSDMCNHVDSPEIKLRVNDSFLEPLLTSTESRIATRANYTTDTEAWFKAATIAVPICGALILFLLIALAVKILRRDGLDSNVAPKHNLLCANAARHDIDTSKFLPLLRRQRDVADSRETRDNVEKFGFVPAARNDSVPISGFEVVCGRQVENTKCKLNNINYRDVTVIHQPTLNRETLSNNNYCNKQSHGFCNIGGITADSQT